MGGLDDPALPAAYRATRMARADNVAESIRAAGGLAAAMEADRSQASSVPALFDAAEADFGPVSILVNNASGWVGDTFVPATANRFGLAQVPVSAQSIDQVFEIDARAPALLIAEFARRHLARNGEWGRIIGMTSGEADGFPEEASYGAATNVVHPPMTDTGWINQRTAGMARSTGQRVATPRQVAEVIANLASDAADLVTGNILRLR